jgi:hypothetical protein
MIWQGFTDSQICQSIEYPKQNKNRNIDQLVEHLTEDKLVMWDGIRARAELPSPFPR